MSIAESIMDARLRALAASHIGVIDLGLSRMLELLAGLGNPHLRLPPVIHVAGTNGKGSLIAYLQAILQAAGLRVHRYISPGLVHFNERIVLAGDEIADAKLEDVFARVAEASKEHPATVFELTTAMAFLAFAEMEADVLLLEVGMGGRLDATNVISNPLLTVITPVALDHREFLGETLAAIAYEKAGIIKPGVPCVVGPQAEAALDVIERVAAEKNAPLFRFGKEWRLDNTEYLSERMRLALTPSLAGGHQYFNAATAAASAELFFSSPRRGEVGRGGKYERIFHCSEQVCPHPSPPPIGEGIAAAIWPGRLQRITQGPLAGLCPEGVELWIDGGHNPHAGEALAQWVEGRGHPVYLVLGMLVTKDALGFLRPLADKLAGLIACPVPGDYPCHPPGLLAAESVRLGIAAGVAPGLAKAVSLALMQAEQCGEGHVTILIGGSLHMASAVLDGSPPP